MVSKARKANDRLARVIAEAGMTHAQVARAVVRVAVESGAQELAAVSRSHVTHWVAGATPSGRAPAILAEALARRTGRPITLEEIGLASVALTPLADLDWKTDTLTSLADLARMDLDMDRRSVLASTTYSVAGLALPAETWWERAAARLRDRPGTGTGRRVGCGDLEAVQETTRVFSRIDQRHGGGHARSAVVQYLISDVAVLLRGRFHDESTRQQTFSAAGELAYLAGWMAFDNAEHAAAQRYFGVSLKLAAEAQDAPLAGHVLRAMAHQAIDLGHAKAGLDLAAASLDRDRYAYACPRERSLLGVVYAKALSTNGHRAEAASALLRAEDDLRASGSGDNEPSRVFFFGEASLAHETACALRDCGDLDGAMREFRRSVRLRSATHFARTHAVTLGYLGSVQARRGDLDEACATWSRALDATDGVHSGRVRNVVTDMRDMLTPLRARGIAGVQELDARASAFMAVGR